MPSLTRNIPHASDTEKRILAKLKDRFKFWERHVQDKFKKFTEAEDKLLAAIPETEVDSRRKSSREQGAPQYTTIQIPYSYATVLAAHTYVTSVFMGRSPVLQYSGRHGESMQKIQGMEALADYQVMVGGMLKYLYTWIYDCFKYGYGVMGLYWENRIEAITEVVDQPEVNFLGEPTGKTSRIQQTEFIRKYSGNTVFNIQPQYFVWDTRFPVREFQKGEFCGRRVKLPWNEIVRREKQGYYINIDKIEKSHSAWSTSDGGSSNLGRPEVYSSVSGYTSENQDETDHPMMVDAYELVVEIIPPEWELGQSDFPEKWVFTFTADFTVLMGVQPLGAWHCNYPFLVAPLEPEGYGLISRGYPEILEPVQQTIDWLVNAHFYNVRAALNNKVLIDPTKVVMKDLMSPLPGGVIRLKPEAWGTDVRTMVHQFRVDDLTRQHMADLPGMISIGERTVGVNDQMMGMLSTGGRKTATEVRTSTSFGINRLKTVAEFLSATAFDPMSQMIVQNSQQYYDMELIFRIAGDQVMNSGGQNFLMVTPELISGFYDFVPVDGTLPIDRMAQVQIWTEIMQTIGSIPQIGLQYDLGGIFQWVAQLAGLKNITQFKIQIQPDEVFNRMIQLGNSAAAPTGRQRKEKGSKAQNQLGGQQVQRALAAPMLGGQ